MEKKTSSANKLVSKRILNQEGNNKCADCKTATHPRWASWNIGILICIRCSGIHRSSGTHISKVRSIDLDTWNDTQLEKLVQFGNTRANSYWEAQLPPNYIPDESKIANFIKTKYELKRWIPKNGTVPAQVAAAPPTVPPKVRSTNVDSSDSNDAFSLKSSTTQTGSVQNIQNFHKSQSTTEFSRQSSSSSSAISDLSISRSHQPSPVSAPLSQTPTPSTQGNRADVKKSISSLYAQPSKPRTPQPTQTSTITPGYPIMQNQQPQNNSTSSSFGQRPQRTESHIPLDEDNFASIWN